MTAYALAISVTLVLMGGYFVSVFWLLRRLELRHAETWRALGSPAWSNFGVVNGLRSVGFIFFGGVFAHWNDRALRWRAILVWVLFLTVGAAIFAAKRLEAGA